MSSSRHLVDPELLPLLDLLPAFDLSDATLAAIRGSVDAMVSTAPVSDDVVITKHSVPGATPVDILLYRPRRQEPVPILLHMHGGGFVTGSAALMAISNTRMAIAVGCAVASVDYRLAPEAIAPAALDDCHAAYRWLHANAARLALDVTRLAIGGESAGGGLAASLALRLRDCGDPAPCLQWLIAPMLDDASAAASDSRPNSGEFVWTLQANQYAWRAYLGHAPGRADTSPYASAARAVDLTRLPPVYMTVGALDLFVDENMAYAQRLIDAGVATEFHIYPGAFHGFESALDTRLGQRAEFERHHALSRAFARGTPAPESSHQS
jgi:triacylglycerol lipase